MHSNDPSTAYKPEPSRGSSFAGQQVVSMEQATATTQASAAQDQARTSSRGPRPDSSTLVSTLPILVMIGLSHFHD
jgi:hypothetical protein